MAQMLDLAVVTKLNTQYISLSCFLMVFKDEQEAKKHLNDMSTEVVKDVVEELELRHEVQNTTPIATEILKENAVNELAKDLTIEGKKQ